MTKKCATLASLTILLAALSISLFSSAHVDLGYWVTSTNWVTQPYWHPASNTAVRARFSLENTTVYKNENVTFDASESQANSGTIISYDWNFGDNTTSTEKIVNKTYANEGIYKVKLTVTNSYGESGSQSMNITVIRRLFHNIAILNLDFVASGRNWNLSATIDNNGDFAENANIIFYSNDTVIDTETSTIINGSSTTVDYFWNSTGLVPGNYSITAYAAPVQGETNTTDNTFIAGRLVHVGMIGDINNDDIIDMKDISYMARRFMIPQSDPLWDPVADMNADGKIDMKDISYVARHFLEHF